MNLRESARTFYILTANLRFFSRFSVNSRAVDRILRDLRYIPRKICCREMPRNLKKRGISRQQIFRGIYRKSREIRSIAREFTENLQKNRKLAVNISNVRALSRKFTVPRTFLIAITHYGVRKITGFFYSV